MSVAMKYRFAPDYWQRGFVVYGSRLWPSHSVWFVPGLISD